MAAPYDPTDPANLSPDQRLDEVAALLAAGVERVLALSAGSLQVPPTLPTPPVTDSERNPLDDLAETRPHVPHG